MKKILPENRFVPEKMIDPVKKDEAVKGDDSENCSDWVNVELSEKRAEGVNVSVSKTGSAVLFPTQIPRLTWISSYFVKSDVA